MHGGASTAPRTPEGLARIVAAKTTHGRYGMAAAPKRLAQRYVRTLITRIALTDAATQLRAYLPAGMAARLEASVPGGVRGAAREGVLRQRAAGPWVGAAGAGGAGSAWGR